MWTAPVVPREVKVKFPPEVLAAKRQERVAQAFLFHRADEAFDERDAAVPADGPDSSSHAEAASGLRRAGARPDAATLAPALEPLAPELRPFVRRSPILPLRSEFTRLWRATSALKSHPACKSRAKLRGKTANPSAALHNIGGKTRVLRGRNGAIVAHCRAKVAA